MFRNFSNLVMKTTCYEFDSIEFSEVLKKQKHFIIHLLDMFSLIYFSPTLL